MVDVAGHLGMALIWLAPAWFLTEQTRTAAAFVGASVWFGVLPDVDIYLSQLTETVQHHGILHTVLAVTVLAAVLGPALGWLLDRYGRDSRYLSSEIPENTATIGFLAVWIPGLSHVFADMLSAPDIAQAVEPAWPLYQQSIGVDLVWYNDPWFNWGLLLAGIGLNLVLYGLQSTAPTGRRTTP